MIGRLINDELINEDDIRSIFLIYLGMDVSFKMLVQLLRSKYQVVFELLFDNLFIPQILFLSTSESLIPFVSLPIGYHNSCYNLDSTCDESLNYQSNFCSNKDTNYTNCQVKITKIHLTLSRALWTSFKRGIKSNVNHSSFKLLVITEIGGRGSKYIQL